MIADFKHYPKMKDSGVPWLRNVPEHWEILPLARLLKERKEKNDPVKTTNILSLSLETGVIPYADKKPGGNKAKEDLSAYMLAYPGDIVVNSMNVVVGSVGLSKYFGAVSPVYYMLRPRSSNDLVEYFDAIFRDVVFQRSLFGLGNGILYIESKSSGKLNTIRLRISMSKLKRVPLPYPCPDEQSAIVRFVGYANRRIDRYIRAKKKLISLLNEQKQAIIHRAVTRGLDPNVGLKPSGIPWLGEVPEHWEIVPLKRIARIIDGDRGREYPNVTDFVTTGIPFLSSKSIMSGKINFQNVAFISETKFDRLGQGKLTPGDLVVTVRGTIGNSALFTGEEYKTGFINAQMMIVRPDEERVLKTYLATLASSRYWMEQLGLSAYGSAQQQLSNRILSDIQVPIPSREEQQAILLKLRDQVDPLDGSISHTEREIALIREYRTRLVADVVTGQLDVREAAAKLPEESEEEEVESVEESIEDEADSSEFEDMANSGTIGQE